MCKVIVNTVKELYTIQINVEHFKTEFLISKNRKKI